MPQFPPNPELDPVVCRLIDELTERINRGESVDFQKVIAANPEQAELLEEIIPTLKLFLEVGESATRQAFFASPMPSTPSVPFQELGDFRLIRQIGRGGMGVVYEAEQISLDRRVALKVLPFAGVLDERQLQRFKNEARAAAGLTHPNIVPVYAVGSERGVHYYAMQFINGPTLSEVIASDLQNAGFTRARLTLHNAATICVQNGTDVPQNSHDVEITHDGHRRAPNPLPENGSRGQDGESPNDGSRHPIQDPKAEQKLNAHSKKRSSAETTVRGSSDQSHEQVLKATTEKFSASTFTNRAQRYRMIAEWGAQVAEALEYAHSVGVVHRDIKPANLMLDAEGHVWITDFGLAQLELGAGPTMTGDIIGTLRYMSPEQAVGEKGLLDQRTDVYSLGVTLYELLTLQPLFRGHDQAKLLHKILHDDPPSIHSIAPGVPPDLATIVHKSMERDLAARYTTAGEMAADLRRFLQERPIRARPPTLVDRARKWLRRNPLLVRFSTVFALITMLCLGGAALLVHDAHQQANLLRRASEAEKELSESAQRSARVNRYVTRINLADHAWRTGQISKARRLLEECHTKNQVDDAGDDDIRGFEWHYLWQAISQAPQNLGSHTGDAYSASVSPDGKVLATAGQDGVRIWNLATGTPIQHLVEHSSEVNCVSFSSDGRLLATASDDQTVKIWSTKDWKCFKTLPHAGDVVAAVFSADSGLLATGERTRLLDNMIVGDNLVRFWNPDTWEQTCEIRTGHTSTMHAVAFSHDGTLLATCSSDGIATIWDVASRTPKHRLKHRISSEDDSAVACVAFAHHHRWLATVGNKAFQGAVRLWNVDDGSQIGVLSGPQQDFQGVSFSADDSLVVAGGNESQIGAWQIRTDGTPICREVLPSTSRVWSVNFIGDAEIVSTGRDGNIQRRNLFSPELAVRISCTNNPCPEFAFHPSGQSLAIADCGLVIHSLAKNVADKRIESRESNTVHVAISANGRSVATAADNGRIRIRDLDDPQVIRATSIEHRPIRLAFAKRDELLAVTEFGGITGIVFIEVKNAKRADAPVTTGNESERVDFSPDGQTYSVSRTSGSLELWKDGQRLWSAGNFGSLHNGVVFSADGRQIALSREDGTILVIKVSDPKSAITIVGSLIHRSNLCFSADGRTLAGLFGDGTIKLWNIASGRELVVIDSKLTAPWQIAFSPTGNVLVASGANAIGQGEVVVWQPDADALHGSKPSSAPTSAVEAISRDGVHRRK